MGVERRCAIATDKNAAEGRPQGLYGRLFATASIDVVKKAVRPIVPPTRSNVIAIEAPSHGRGAYSKAQISYILQTALTGFSAACQESIRTFDPQTIPEVVIHTGFWGCGAFGGNRILMTVLQVVAARMAGVHKIVFHTVDPQGAIAFERSKKVLSSVIDRIGFFARLTGMANRNEGEPIKELIERIEGLGLEWGTSDGN